MAREEAVALAKVGVTPAEKIDPMVWVNAVDWDQEEFPWLPYTRARARAVVEAGYPVFIDYTATWCMTCRSNKMTVLETDRVRQAMQQLGIIPFKADYTIEKPEIREDLEKYGSANVPMYLVFPAGKPDDANKLDEILTSPASFIASLERIIGKKLPADSTRAPSTTSSE
jgi:thiol:disulfide interchange protein